MKMPSISSNIFRLALLMVAVFFNFFPQNIVTANDDKTLSPYFFIKSDQPELDQLPLKHTSAKVNIAGVIADVQIKQVYENKGNQKIEAIYVFPGSTRAAVYAMKMTIGERVIVAKIEKRATARQQYQEAQQQGKTAALLEQSRPNVFQMNVANILPGDKITVEMAYTELLIPTDGVYEFVYPTVVGPRYSETPDALASSGEEWIQNPYTAAGIAPLYTFGLTASLESGLPIKKISCTSHEVDVNFKSRSNAKISLKDSERAGGNRDFVLHYTLGGSNVESGLLLFEGKKENFFLLMIQPPKRPRPDQIPAREYIFIVDVSGSMNGYPLDISKTLLKNLIGNLKPTDKFNVILFAGTTAMMSPTSLPASSHNISKAIQTINNQRGGGGTRLLPALKKALALPGIENVSRSVVIVTDGYVSVEKEAFDLIRNNLNGANFFSFGIGNSVNRHLIEGIAHVGMGEPFVLLGPKEAKAKAAKFRKYIQSPVLTNIDLDFGDFEVYDLEPASVPDVLAERPVIVFGKYKGRPRGTISLKGITGSERYVKRIDVGATVARQENSSLKSLWARHRIRILDDYGQFGTNESMIEELTQLGLDYNLLTAHTSFVAIDTEIRSDGSPGKVVKQPLPLPQGVSNLAIGGGSSSSQAMFKSAGGSRRLFRSPMMEVAEEFHVVSSNDKKPEKEEVFKVVELMPQFPGGQSALQKFLKANIKYPAKAKQSGIEGTVYMRFIVDKNGKVKDIQIIRGVNKELNLEAIRVLKLMPNWKPGTQRGTAVAVLMTVPVKFSL